MSLEPIPAAANHGEVVDVEEGDQKKQNWTVTAWLKEKQSWAVAAWGEAAGGGGRKLPHCWGTSLCWRLVMLPKEKHNWTVTAWTKEKQSWVISAWGEAADGGFCGRLW
ncbi:hypothetical protein OIU78_003352 [Salix suchowensis]|nr:hypothetical protein OIU78_003352 [Salix suchowensis]